MADSTLKKEQFGSPEDVSTLFAWANMRGAKYRDFSASRAQARVEIRRRVQEAVEEQRIRQIEQSQREAQEAAQRAAQEAAAQAEAIRRAEAERLAEIARQADAERQAVLSAQEAQRRAQAQRPPSQTMPPPVTAATLAPTTLTPTAPASGYDAGIDSSRNNVPVTMPAAEFPQAEFAHYPHPDAPWPQAAESGSSTVFAKSAHHSGVGADTLGTSNQDVFLGTAPGMYPRMEKDPSRAPSMHEHHFSLHGIGWGHPHTAPPSDESYAAAHPASMHGIEAGAGDAWNMPNRNDAPPPQWNAPPAQFAAPQHTPQETMEDWERPLVPAWLEELPHARINARTDARINALQPPAAPSAPPTQRDFTPAQSNAPAWEDASWANPQQRHSAASIAAPAQRGNFRAEDAQNWPAATRIPDPLANWNSQASRGAEAAQPAMRQDLARQDFPLPGDTAQAIGRASSAATPADDPLLASRQRINRNWFALKSVFHAEHAQPEQPMPQTPERVPALAIFSLAGGVGKTSLLASLARALSSRAERVLLVDLAAYGLMPFFFGARDQKPGQLRTFSPPTATADAAIHMVTLDLDRLKGEVDGHDTLVREIQQHASGVHRILIDLPTASGAAMRRALLLHPTVLVPLTPDMNSVVSVGAIESFFQNQMAQSNAQTQPLYVLNHFDPAQQLHLDVRNLLREQIGNRLLPFVLRSCPAVSEALAEGMTVMDYAPGTVIAEDYMNLANWIRSLSAPAAVVPRGVRWSEQ